MTNNPPWLVTRVQPRLQRLLDVEFSDGTAGSIDLSDLIYANDAGVFRALRDDEEFFHVFIENGAVVWPCGVDLAPDAMWARITGNE